MRARVVLGALGALIVLGVGVGLVVSSDRHDTLSPGVPNFPASSTLSVGDKVPFDFTLQQLGGGAPINLKTALSGKAVVINLFASWCPSCVAELHAFGVVSAHQSRVVFLGIDTNDPDTNKVRALLEKAGAHYRVVLDTPSLGVASAYGIANLPTTLYVASNGRLVASVLGAETAAQLRAHLKSLH